MAQFQLSCCQHPFLNKTVLICLCLSWLKSIENQNKSFMEHGLKIKLMGFLNSVKVRLKWQNCNTFIVLSRLLFTSMGILKDFKRSEFRRHALSRTNEGKNSLPWYLAVSVVDGHIPTKLEHQADDANGSGKASPMHGSVPSNTPDVGVSTKMQEDVHHVLLAGVGGHKEGSLSQGIKRFNKNAYKRWKVALLC